MTKKEFLQLEQNKSQKSTILTSAILCYISAAVTAIVGITSSSIGGVSFSPAMTIDAVIILALGLLIHLKQSFPAGIILFIYSIVNVAYMVISTGTFGGWILLLAGGAAAYSTYKLNKDYKAFSANNSIDTFEVTSED